jgi:NAD(P)-dependent dehydrogenase (short-subunit alcohol dehydrogenase family)
MAPYAASKAGVETLTRYLAWELREHGIAANVLRIDRAVATEGARRVNSDDGVEWVSPQEAALSALWLARQPASYSGRTVIMSEIGGTPAGEQ